MCVLQLLEDLFDRRVIDRGKVTHKNRHLVVLVVSDVLHALRFQTLVRPIADHGQTVADDWFAEVIMLLVRVGRQFVLRPQLQGQLLGIPLGPIPGE